MLIGTTWKARPLSPEQAKRMMDAWGKTEAASAADPNEERVCWFITADGTAGVTVSRFTDADAATKSGLRTALLLSEFIDLDSRPVLDLESAGPVIMAAMEEIG
jgi:hypothetical protein